MQQQQTALPKPICQESIPASCSTIQWYICKVTDPSKHGRPAPAKTRRLCPDSQQREGNIPENSPQSNMSGEKNPQQCHSSPAVHPQSPHVGSYSYTWDKAQVSYTLAIIHPPIPAKVMWDIKIHFTKVQTFNILPLGVFTGTLHGDSFIHNWTVVTDRGGGVVQGL